MKMMKDNKIIIDGKDEIYNFFIRIIDTNVLILDIKPQSVIIKNKITGNEQKYEIVGDELEVMNMLLTIGQEYIKHLLCKYVKYKND